jgi:LuxR family maltose regulon positive regulatory protein
MSTPILTSKLFIPPPRPQAVFRPRLIELLNEGLYRKLTLVSAPAGFGKTTLISEWVAGCERAPAWLSLDKEDSDPTRFLIYLVTALRTVEATVGDGVLDVLQSPQPPPTETLLTALLNEITSKQVEIVFVLDDYHLVDATPIDDALTFLLEHLPPQLHLVVATREDPQFPLMRLRASDQLSELRAADLRFTSKEAAAFLNEVMRLELSDGDVEALEARTEGWIAGLQLAALSLQGRGDAPIFIEDFAGDDRYIIDYLFEEVLLRQPEKIRNFLLQTAILNRLSSPLCDAVTHGEDAKRLLETLERGNLFVVPLDSKRNWFRYHHLFADVLRAYAMEEEPNQVPVLHLRASEWYEKNGFHSEAIHHALAAEDFERAADLVERAWLPMDENRRAATWLGWVKALPDEQIRARPVISVGYAWSLLEVGELEEGAARLRDAEERLKAAGASSAYSDVNSTDLVVADEEAFRMLPASIATAHCYHAMALDDLQSTMKYARQALDLTHEKDRVQRGTLEALLGLASWTSGDLGAAERSFANAMTGYQLGSNVLFAITAGFILGQIQAAQGHLREAKVTYERSLRLVKGRDATLLYGTAELYTVLSELYLEWNDLEAAQQHLLRSKELGERAPLPHWDYRWCVAQARLLKAQGDLSSAVSRLDEAERLYIRGPVPDVRPIAAHKTRVWIALGKQSEAQSWARERGLSTDDDLNYLREFEHITLARLLIARYENERTERSLLEASALLECLLEAAEQGGRTGSAIEILVLQALAYEAHGDTPSALAALERALTLAEPEGYARLFIDEGAPMAHLLSEATAQGVLPEYGGALLAALEAELQEREGHLSLSKSQPNLSLGEPLSERELEVLQLIAQGLSNSEISKRIYRALDTVKGYNRNIFGKLQVHNRTDAVARARELGLIPPDSR